MVEIKSQKIPPPMAAAGLLGPELVCTVICEICSPLPRASIFSRTGMLLMTRVRRLARPWKAWLGTTATPPICVRSRNSRVAPTPYSCVVGMWSSRFLESLEEDLCEPHFNLLLCHNTFIDFFIPSSIPHHVAQTVFLGYCGNKYCESVR